MLLPTKVIVSGQSSWLPNLYCDQVILRRGINCFFFNAWGSHYDKFLRMYPSVESVLQMRENRGQVEASVSELRIIQLFKMEIMVCFIKSQVFFSSI